MLLESPLAEDSRSLSATPLLAVAFIPALVMLAFAGLSPLETAANSQSPASIQPVPLEIRIAADGSILFAGAEFADQSRPALQHAWEAIHKQGFDPASTLVIVRADREVATGNVQKVIASAQTIGFRRFVLRPARPSNTAGPQP